MRRATDRPRQRHDADTVLRTFTISVDTELLLLGIMTTSTPSLPLDRGAVAEGR